MDLLKAIGDRDSDLFECGGVYARIVYLGDLAVDSDRDKGHIFEDLPSPASVRRAYKTLKGYGKNEEADFIGVAYNETLNAINESSRRIDFNALDREMAGETEPVAVEG